MHKTALLALALSVVVGVGCKKKKTEVEPMAASGSGSTMAGSSMAGSDTMAGSGSAMAGSGSAASGGGSGSDSGSAAGSGSAASTKTSFAPFDDALAGTKPWISADEAKAGVVEMVIDEDLSGKTKPVRTVKRLCGDDAKKAAEKMGAAFVTHTKAGDRDPTDCKTDGDKTTCVSPGVGEGDSAYVLEYRKNGDAWTLIGVQWLGMGINSDKEDAQYTKLLAGKCK